MATSNRSANRNNSLLSMMSPSPRRRNLRTAPSAPAEPNTRTLLRNYTPNRVLNILTRNNANLERKITSINKLPRPTGRPKLVVKWGPPASGKGSAAVKSAIASLGDPLNSYFNLNIDALIEESNWFKRASRLQAKLVLAKNTPKLKGLNINSSNIKNISNKLNNLSGKNTTRLGGPYKWLRFKFPLPGTPSRNKPYRTPGNVQDEVLGDVMRSGRNVTFETTGERGHGWPGWLFAKLRQENIARHNYQIVFVFPLLPFSETWARYKSRAIKSYKSGEGFRFASTRSQLRDTYRNSYINFRNIMNNPDQYSRINRVILVHPYHHPSKSINFTIGNNYRTIVQRARVRNFLQAFLTNANLPATSKNLGVFNQNLKKGVGAN